METHNFPIQTGAHHNIKPPPEYSPSVICQIEVCSRLNRTFRVLRKRRNTLSALSSRFEHVTRINVFNLIGANTRRRRIKADIVTRRGRIKAVQEDSIIRTAKVHPFVAIFFKSVRKKFRQNLQVFRELNTKTLSFLLNFYSDTNREHYPTSEK